jgi:DNA-binding NtrC family response regulator
MARICDAPDDVRELTDAEQTTVATFFNLLGADLENAARDEREADLFLVLFRATMASPVFPPDARIPRLARLIGIQNLSPVGPDDPSPWRLWDSVQGAWGFVEKYVKPFAKLLGAGVNTADLANSLFELPERFRRFIDSLVARANAGEFSDDARGVRRLFRFEYLRLLLVGWDEFTAQRRNVFGMIPRRILPQVVRTILENGESSMATLAREHLPELWDPPHRRWVRIHRAIRWLVDEQWPRRAPVLDEIGDAGALIKFRLVHAALANGPVLILGEPGTGKDLAARAIHQLRHGQSDSSPFRPVNCGAVSRELIRSELFGHERGAFTGAVGASAGAFAEAENGTVFLDEIGEMPLDVQPHLLRALSARKAARLGGSKEIDLQADVVAATNQELTSLIVEKRFRQDLFDRLNGQAAIRLPPLSARDPDDIAAIWKKLLAQAAVRAGRSAPEVAISRSEAALLARRTRKGNVRTLERLADSYVRWNSGAIVSSVQDFLAQVDLSDDQSEQPEHPWPTPFVVAAVRAEVERSGSLDLVRDQLEEAVIAEVLAESDGRQAEAARRLGWSPDRLQKRNQRRRR